VKPLYIYGAVLLATGVALALLGIFLMRVKYLRPRQIATYARVATLVFLLAAYGMAQGSWPGVHLRTVDLWSLLVILGILVVSLLHAALNHAVRDVDHEDFSKSYMLSMLYTDSEQDAEQELLGVAAKEAAGKRTP
jgi:hypothetical protein